MPGRHEYQRFGRDDTRLNTDHTSCVNERCDRIYVDHFYGPGRGYIRLISTRYPRKQRESRSSLARIRTRARRDAQ